MSSKTNLYTLALAPLATSIIFIPNLLFDSFNPPKLATLVIFTFTSFLVFLTFSFRQLFNHKKLLFLAYLLFLISLTSALFFSSSNLWPQFFGSFGRNTGYLAYLSLLLLAYMISLSWSEKLEDLIFKGLRFVVIFNLIYSFLQFIGSDPVAWSNVASPIFGSFGNANFYGAFLGVACSLFLAYTLDTKRSAATRLYFVAIIAISQFLVWKSTSNQGIIIFLISTSITFYFMVVQQKFRILVSILYWFLVSVVFALGAAGVLNRGPLAKILFQESTLYRGDYWRAGWNMGLANPITGVGLDSYGDWWWKFRDQTAVARNSDLFSNASHNVFIDMFANGGLPLFLSHLFIFIIITYFAIKNVIRKSASDTQNIALLSAWVAFLFQSLVNINHLGLAVWGWILIGVISGKYYLEKESKIETAKSPQIAIQKASNSISQFSKKLSLGVYSVFFLLSMSVSIWPLHQDFEFKKIVSRNNLSDLYRVANTFPNNEFYSATIAQALMANKKFDDAIQFALLTLKSNPNNLAALKVIATNPLSTASQRKSVKEKLFILNPYE